MARLFFLFARHPDHRQLPRVAFTVTREPLAQGGRIARIGLHPRALLVEFARRNDITVRPGRHQLPVKAEPEAARFVDYVHLVPSPQQALHQGHKLPGRKAPGRLGQEMIVLRYGHVKPGMDIQSDLDDRTGTFYFTNGRLA